MASKLLLPFDQPDPNSLRERLRVALARLAAKGIYFGGSSWKYLGWVNQIYTEHRYLTRGRFSKKKFDEECLAEYAEIFPSVGGDFSFYNFPTNAQWEHLFKTAPNLLFGFKTPEMITVPKWPSHARYGSRGGQENDSFLDAGLMTSAFLQPLSAYQQQVGVVMLEFGSMSKSTYPHVDAFVDDLDHFLAALPLSFRYAVEIRNEDYFAEPYFQCLRAHRVAHVFNSWSRMPPLPEQITQQNAFTADFIVARALLRPGRVFQDAVELFQPYTHVQQPYPEVRNALVDLSRRAMEQHVPGLFFVNNRLEGNSPETIMSVSEMLHDDEGDT